MLGQSTDSNPFSLLDYLLYFIFVCSMFLIFSLGYILFYKFLTKNQSTNNNPKILYVGIITLVISFIIFSICVEFPGVAADGNLYLPPIQIPNPFPWFVSYGGYSSVIEVYWYHIFIFLIFFPLIGLGFTIMDYLHFRSKKRTLRMVIMFFGANLLGLMWQDFYYFVSSPTDFLIPGERYGVYFDQWLGPIPTMYIVTNCIGIGLIWLMSMRCGLKYSEIYRFLVFIGVILTIGVTIHSVKIPFIS